MTIKVVVVFCRMDTTRISYTIPLRESFGFPFLFVQIAFINFFLKRDASSLAQVFADLLTKGEIIFLLFLFHVIRHGRATSSINLALLL